MQRKTACLLYSPKATAKACRKSHVRFTPKADMRSALAHVCFGPIADMKNRYERSESNVAARGKVTLISVNSPGCVSTSRSIRSDCRMDRRHDADRSLRSARLP